MSFDYIKVILIYCFIKKKRNLKNEIKPSRCKGRTVGLWICSQMRYRWSYSGLYLIYIKKESTLHALWEKNYV